MGSVIRTSVLSAPRLVRERSGWLLIAGNAAMLVLLLVFLFAVHSDTPALRMNQVAGETVVAQQQVTFKDQAATAAKRKHAMAAVRPAYRFDPRAAIQHTALATRFLDRAGRILALPAPATTKQAAILKLVPRGIRAEPLAQFPILSAADFKTVRDDSRSLLEQAETWRFSNSDEQPTELGLLSTISPRLTRDQRSAIIAVLESFLTPTQVEDATKTQQLREAAAQAVAPVWVTIYRGEVVVRHGDVITPPVMEKLNALGLHGHQTGWNDILASFLFASVILSMLFWYLHTFHRGLLAQPRLILFIDGAILLTVLVARLLAGGHVLLPFVLPVAAVSTFAAVLIAPEACIALTMAIAALAGWVVADSFELTVFYLVTGAVGVLAIRHVRQLKQFIMAGAYIAVFAFGTELAFGLLDRSYDFAALQEHAVAAAANGFLSSTLALGGFALLSGFFGVTTTLQLLELGQPNQPLLRRLMVKAPGTYNHSLILASMVEHAAEEMGADALAAKVGALYHDVGKTANPHCFIENQLGMGNLHDELRSDESARIIRGHVAQGLRLARQHTLPHLILDAIAEHHGTMQLTYFLHKAQQEADGMPIDRSLYAYPGPRPQTKETGLIMLADGCESAVRASADHSDGKIHEIVDHIFRERIKQAQLDECPLTLRDLHIARRAFCSVLGSLYHPRIEYPDTTEHMAEVETVPTIAGLPHGRSTRGA